MGLNWSAAFAFVGCSIWFAATVHGLISMSTERDGLRLGWSLFALGLVALTVSVLIAGHA